MATTTLPLLPTEATPAQWRAAFRAGATRPTSGLAPGHTQANLVCLPREYAYDLLLFAQRNPKPCPLLEVTDPGSWSSALAAGADLRTDLPGTASGRTGCWWRPRATSSMSGATTSSAS